jgi:phosphohistidine phosphatase
MRMHLLHLLRHAKSSWREDVDDHARPLNKRGRAAAGRVGRNLPHSVAPIDLVLCSSALRTRQTLDLVVAGLAQAPACVVEDGLYLADCERLIDRLQQLDEGCPNVMLIGHNPGLHALAMRLADPDTEAARALLASKFPTAARASFGVETPWSQLGRGHHRVVAYVPLSALPDEEEE